MKQLFLFLIVVVSAVAPQAYAYKIIGNGGMVVVCAKGTGEPEVRLLDVYETEDTYNAPQLPPLRLSNPEGGSYREKFLNLVERIKTRFPDLTRQILVEFENFEKYTAFKRKKLPDTADDFHSDLPIGCELKQLVVQREPMFQRRPWFTVAVEYWDRMDDFNKAATVLHETLLRIGVQNGVEHSIGVRYLVGLLLADDLQSISDQDWIEAFTQSRIRNYELGALKIPLFTGAFLPCRPSPGTVMCSRKENLKVATLRYSVERRLAQVSYETIGEVVRFKSSNVSGAMVVKDMYFDWTRDRDVIEIVTEGEITLSSPETQIIARFQGRVMPALGIFNGNQTLVLGKKMDIDTPMEFQGSFVQLLSRFGVNNVDQLPFTPGGLAAKPSTAGLLAIGSGENDVVDLHSDMHEFRANHLEPVLQSR